MQQSHNMPWWWECYATLNQALGRGGEGGGLLGENLYVNGLINWPFQNSSVMGEIENYAWSRACQMEMMNVTQLKLGCKRNGTFIYSWEGWWEARKGREEEVLGLCWGPKAKKPAIQNTPSFKISYQCKERYQCLVHNSTCMASPYSHIKVDVYIYIYIYMYSMDCVVASLYCFGLWGWSFCVSGKWIRRNHWNWSQIVINCQSLLIVSHKKAMHVLPPPLNYVDNWIRTC